MNNLKRVLALSLAATSILSAAASASFADTADLDTESAISTLVGLGVIKGYEDGTFRPEATVTRAEMAKMIYTIKNGGNDASDLFVDVSTNLSDISGHWAEGYVKYCESLGIIAGRGDGKFYPEATVTGTEAIKMALVVLGYDADVSSLVGSNWDVSTLALGSTIGLTTGFVGSLSASAQRQSAATVLYNALYAEVVRYSGISEYYTGTEQTLAAQSFNLVTLEEVEVVSSTSSTLVVDTTPSSTATTLTLNGNLDLTDYEGLKVDILYNTDTKNVYGVKQVIGSTIVSDLASNIDIDTTNNIVTIKDLEIELDTGLATTLNSTIINDNAKVTVVDYDGRNSVAGTATEIIKVKEVAVAQVTATSSTRATLTAVTDASISADLLNDAAEVALNGATPATNTEAMPASVEFSKNNVDDVAEDDFVTVSYSKYDGTYTVEKIESQIGTVDAVRTNTSEYRIDGVWYTSNQDTTKKIALSLNEQVEFWAVDGVIYAKETILAQSNFAVVTAIGNDGGYDNTESYVTLYTAEGKKVSGLTDKVYITKDGETVAVTTDAVAVGDIVAYGTNSADEIYLYTNYAVGYDHSTDAADYTNDIDFGVGTAITVDTFNASTNKFTNTTPGDEAFIYDDAIVFVTDATSTTVITGADLKSWKVPSSAISTYTLTSAVVYAETEKGGYDYANLAHITISGSIPAAAATNSVTGVIVDVPYEDSDFDDNTVLTIWDGTEEITVYAEIAHTLFSKGDYVTVLLGEDNVVATSDIVALTVATDTVVKVTIKSSNESELTVSTGITAGGLTSATVVTIAEDVVVFDHNDMGVAKSISTVQVGDSVDVALNSDDEIAYIIIK